MVCQIKRWSPLSESNRVWSLQVTCFTIKLQEAIKNMTGVRDSNSQYPLKSGVLHEVTGISQSFAYLPGTGQTLLKYSFLLTSTPEIVVKPFARQHYCKTFYKVNGGLPGT